MTERTQEDIREQHRRICLVPCRQCGASGAVPGRDAGDPCRGPSGATTRPHGVRRADAAAAGTWVPGGHGG